MSGNPARALFRERPAPVLDPQSPVFVVAKPRVGRASAEVYRGRSLVEAKTAFDREVRRRRQGSVTFHIEGTACWSAVGLPFEDHPGLDLDWVLSFLTTREEAR